MTQQQTIVDAIKAIITHHKSLRGEVVHDGDYSLLDASHSKAIYTNDPMAVRLINTIIDASLDGVVADKCPILEDVYKKNFHLHYVSENNLPNIDDLDLLDKPFYVAGYFGMKYILSLCIIGNRDNYTRLKEWTETYSSLILQTATACREKNNR